MFKLFGKVKLYIVIGLLLASIVTSVLYYYNTSQNTIRVLQNNNEKLKIAVNNQTDAINVLQSSYRRQSEQLLTLGRLRQELQNEKNALNSVILGHDWEALSRAKPGLIERRINEGTKNLFSNITSLTTSN